MTARRAWGVLVITLGAVRPATSQAPPAPPRPILRDEVARRALATADSLQQRGRWDDANAALESTVHLCGAEAEGRSCRLLLYYGLGYAQQLRASHLNNPGEAKLLLQMAARFYGRVLQEAPGHAATTENLVAVYRALGSDAALQSLLVQAASVDSTRAGGYALLLGDAQRRAGRLDDALESYQRAMAADPDDAAPRQRLVDLYRVLPPGATTRLFHLVSRSKDWELRFPGATIDAYALSVQRLAREDRRTAVDACRRWLRLLAEAQLLDMTRLAGLRDSWLGPDMAALGAFVAHPDSLPPPSPLWLDDEGVEALGRVALALGRADLGHGNAHRAEKYWQAGLGVAGSRVPVALDLSRELATLYFRDSTLDLGGRKFNALEGDLLLGKAEAISRADREAIQRFHAVLGLIYAERGQWGSPFDPRGALFQLDQALQTARDREKPERLYQPLPYLRTLLAKAYAAAHDPNRARDAFVDAAEAHLDADDIEGARVALAQAAQFPPTGRGDTRPEGLVALADLRATFAAGNPSAGMAVPCDTVVGGAARRARNAGLRDEFLRRQTFKLLADCVLNGPPETRAQDAARLFNATLRDKAPLVGVGDLLRLQRVNAAVLQRVTLRGASSHIDTDRSDATGVVVSLSLVGETRATFLTVSPEAVLGARVVEALGPAADSVQLHITGNSVAVMAGQQMAAPDTAVAKRIRRVRGVSAVTQRP